jgi:hypothetical protein
MGLPRNPSPWQLALFVLSLPFLAVLGLIKAVFFPPQSEDSGYRRPTGYRWKDEKGVVHTRYYVYDEPPF